MVEGFVEVGIVAAPTHQDSEEDYQVLGNSQILLSLCLFLCCLASSPGAQQADYC
jgi:hypothetical protein